MKYFKLKFLMVLLALAAAIPPAWAARVTDVITLEGLGLSGIGTSYTDFSGKTFTSDAVYAGKCAGNYSSIQLRSSNEDAGIVTTASGGKVVSVTVTFNSNTDRKTLNIWGKNTAYEAVGDVWSTSKRGTKIGTISSASTTGFTANIDGDYSYVGFSSNSGALYIDKIEIEWATPEDYELEVAPTTLIFGKTAPNTSLTQNVTIKNTGLQPITPTVSISGAEFSTSYVPAEIAKGATVTIPVVFTPTTTGTFEGTMHIGAQESDAISLDVNLTGTSAYELTVCDGTTTSGYLPVYGYNHDSYNQINQMVYPAALLQGIAGKKINSMTFHVSSGYSTGIRFYNGTVTFSLGNLAANTSEYESSPVRKEGYSQVKFIELPSSPSGLEEWTITFDEPFTYNGGDLLIDVATTKGSYGTTNFFGTNQPTYQSYYTSGSNSYERSNFLPKVTFAYEDAGTVIEPDPVLVVEPTTLDVTKGTPATFNLRGENLTGNVTIAVGNENFTVTPATISKEDAEKGATVTVQYNGTNTEGEIANVTVSSEGATTAVVQVKGTATAPQPSEDCPAVIVFKDADNDNSNAFGNNKTSFLETVSDGAGFVETVYSNNVYQGKTGLKFSSSSTNGHLAFDLADLSSGSWKTTKIIVRAKNFGSDQAQLIVNASDPVTLTGEFVDYEFPIAAGTVLNAVDLNAVKRLYVKSIIIMHECGDEPVQVTKPTFDPAAGEYTEAQNVTISCSTPGAAIHYTVDGTEPTAQSAVYSEPIAVGETMTIKAIAVKEGMTDSEIAEATYTINIPEPGEDKIYVKLTTPELTPGKKYIFVYEGSQAMAMGAFNSNNTKCNPVNVTINNNEVNIAGKDDIIEFTAGEGPAVYGSDIKQYTLALPNDKYLAYKSSTDFKLMDAVGNYDTEGLWRINTHDTGYSVYNASATGRSIQKHSSTKMFGPYSDGQDAVAIYVEKSDEPVEPEQVATPTFKNPTGTYTDQVMMEINCETEGATIEWSFNDTDWYTYEEPMLLTSTHTVYAKATKADMLDSEIAEVTYTIVPAEPVATPTLSLVSGSYTGVQTLIIGCETANAVISYSTDSGETWTQGDTVTVDHDMNIIVKAEKDGMAASTVTAYYIIDIPVELPTIEPFKGYYSIKNNGNGKYANIAGRKTLNFTDATADKAGTVIYLETNDKGQVQSLRSQAADLQGYADRAMKYVPEIVQLIADKLHAEGDGNILGDEGLDAIMKKFNESFDHHLYVEEAQGGYRLYGKTPSMQPVVDFYRENTHQVETKLPMLEDFINSAIAKVLEKTGGKGQSILQPFSLRETWQRMGGTLTEPVDEASTMTFYREVLNNKNYVWDFAYETAMTYWERLKNNQTFIDAMSELGEYAQYIEMIEQVRPDFKYYVVQKDDKPDFISEGNKDINDGRAIWTLEPRTDFTVNFPAANVKDNEFYTTLYTDFAYDLPEGVTAYKVTQVTTLGDAQLEALTDTIPAQTPVLLKSTAAGDVTLTLAISDAKAPAGNLLVGPDYLINTYDIQVTELISLFQLSKALLGETFYNNHIAQYEHLRLKNAGTVNNKYFWGLSSKDVEKCTYNNGKDCVVRSLATGDKGLGFYDNWTVNTNSAFLVSEQFNPIRLDLRGDVNRDGAISISDVTAIIDILLVGPENQIYAEPTQMYPRGLDYEAADFNESGEISIKDVTELIDYLLANDLNN